MISGLIEEYNHTEAQQRERLETIFKELKKRTGYRRVKFSDGRVWSNCWTSPIRLSIPAFVDPMVTRIDQVDEGSE